MPKNELSGRGAATSSGTATLTRAKTTEFIRQNRWLSAVLAFLIFVPPVVTTLLSSALPAWAAILIAWFMNLLATIVGLRAIVVVREIRIS